MFRWLTRLSALSQVKEIAAEYFDASGETGLRWQSSALLALQEATEA